MGRRKEVGLGWGKKREKIFADKEKKKKKYHSGGGELVGELLNS